MNPWLKRRPVCQLEPVPTIEELLSLADRFSHQIGTSLFLSGGESSLSHRSLLALFAEREIWIEGSNLFIAEQGGDGIAQASGHNSWQLLQSHLPIDPLAMPWLGYLAYEMGAPSLVESASHKSYFVQCKLLIELDHRADRAFLHLSSDWSVGLGHEEQELIETLLAARSLASLQLEQVDRAPLKESSSIHIVAPWDTLASYSEKIALAKEWILDGLVYQVNLSQQLLLQSALDPMALFAALFRQCPQPYSAFLHSRSSHFLSLSPERFLFRSGSYLETRPIKGTAPRGTTAEEDERLLDRLCQSEKEEAELLMITDLMRNDLARVCHLDSVEVTCLRDYERHPHLFHMHSIVVGKPLEELSPFELIAPCFPAGSVTGCPKWKALELIQKLEKRCRSVYTGAIGYIAGFDQFDFSVAIRTLELRGELLSIQMGGAITIDSDPGAEYEETFHKGAPFLRLLGL